MGFAVRDWQDGPERQSRARVPVSNGPSVIDFEAMIMPAVGFRALKFEQVIKTRLAIAKTFLFIPWLPFDHHFEPLGSCFQRGSLKTGTILHDPGANFCPI